MEHSAQGRDRQHGEGAWGGKVSPKEKVSPDGKKGLLNALGEMLEKRKLVRLVKMCHLGTV